MEYYDSLETQDQKARDQNLREALPVQIAHAKERSPYYAQLLADIDPEAIDSREALADLPVTRKSELQELQQSNMPFGGIATIEPGRATRIYQSPGPIYELEARRADYWRMARALFAAGFRAGDVVHNTFSYHFTPAGAMFESGARALGCAVFPAGVGQTELQVKAIADLQPGGYCGTPSFLKILLEKAAELKIGIASMERALVGGEALPPSLRSEFKQYGLTVYQCYGTADLGLIAYDSEALEGMIADEGVIIEIVRPGTGDPVAEDEVGEVVVTTYNPEYPLIRFATGDLSMLLPGVSPCGRTNLRIKGWMGRADQTTKVKGMFIKPSQVADVLKRHPEVLKGRLVVDSQDHQDIMMLKCEVEQPPEGLADALVDSIREVCKLRGAVTFVDAGSLPNDGKVIDDIRTYE
jgi:phenylacetate-CoA ligase